MNIKTISILFTEKHLYLIKSINMFAIIWRGMGILVPTIFLIIGFIISFFFDGMKTKFGNPDYMKWTAGIVSILLLIISLGTTFDYEEKDVPKEDGFNKYWFYFKQPWNHHFMFVPIVVLGNFFTRFEY